MHLASAYEGVLLGSVMYGVMHSAVAWNVAWQNQTTPGEVVDPYQSRLDCVF